VPAQQESAETALEQTALLSQEWATARSNRAPSSACDRAGDRTGSPMNWLACSSVFSVRLIFRA